MAKKLIYELVIACRGWLHFYTGDTMCFVLLVKVSPAKKGNDQIFADVMNHKESQQKYVLIIYHISTSRFMRKYQPSHD